MSIPSDHIDFDNTVVRAETEEGEPNEGAIQVEIDDGRLFWIPKSQVHADSEAYELGTDGTLIIPEWLADKKGMT